MEVWVAVGSLVLSAVVLASTVGINIQKRLVKIETILTGVDGNNGIAADTRQIRNKIPDLETRVAVIEKRLDLNIVTTQETHSDLRRHLEDDRKRKDE